MRQVKEKMKVGDMDRLERYKLRLESKNPRKAFGRWVLQKVNLQLIWLQILESAKKEARNGNKTLKRV